MIVEVFVVQNVVTCDDCEVCSTIKHKGLMRRTVYRRQYGRL